MRGAAFIVETVYLAAMIDLATGTLNFAEPPLTVGSQFRLSEFLASEPGKRAASLVDNDPWRSWRLVETYAAGIPLAVALYFRGEELVMIDLAHVDARFGTSWDDWSEEKELARKASHDAWLAEHVGERRMFPWGEISSHYDAKGGGSHLSIRYAAWHKR